MKCFFVESTGVKKMEPKLCDCGCGEMFDREMEEFRRTDTGETKFLHPYSWGPGAMYFQEAYCHEGKYRDWDNDTGQHLHVNCPNDHPWDIDSRASNCTLPNDRTHRCWIRHGNPPEITVDKVGQTCAAGAGSIQAGTYHGFLQKGAFT